MLPRLRRQWTRNTRHALSSPQQQDAPQWAYGCPLRNRGLCNQHYPFPTPVRRQHRATNERRAQVGVLHQWLTELDAQRASPPPASPRLPRYSPGGMAWANPFHWHTEDTRISERVALPTAGHEQAGPHPGPALVRRRTPARGTAPAPAPTAHPPPATRRMRSPTLRCQPVRHASRSRSRSPLRNIHSQTSGLYLAALRSVSFLALRRAPDHDAEGDWQCGREMLMEALCKAPDRDS